MNKESFIYNVTVKVAAGIGAEWLQWLQEEHIPEVTATGCFSHAIVLHLFEMDDDESCTYAIQYYTDSIKNHERYIARFANGLQQKSFDKWRAKFIAFRTFMKVVN